MTFDELYFIEGQSAQGDINPAVNPFLYTPPVGCPTYPHIPITPLDLLQVVDKKKLDDTNVKEEKKKRRRKKLLKLMILSQMMNKNN